MDSGIYDYDGGPRVSHDGHIVYNDQFLKDKYDIKPVRKNDRLTVAISGGSMGGLFTAIALEDAGHSVTVYEKTAPGKMRSRGAGIVVQPCNLQYMERKGLVDRDRVVLPVHGLQYLDEAGNVLADLDQTFYLTSWDTTYRSLRNALPVDRYQMDREVTGIAQHESGVDVSFGDGDRTRCDLFVAAEGYRSRTRQQLLPEVKFEYAGYVAWRGILPMKDLPAGLKETFEDTFVYFHGPDFQINGYPVPGPNGGTDVDERRINLVWYSNVPRNDLDEILTDVDGIRRTGSVPPGYVRDDVRRRQIEKASQTLPDVFYRLFTSYENPYIQVIYDIETTRMAIGRVCIIGDAAFFVRPHLAAVTAHAAADGLSLAEATCTSDDLEPALQKWEKERLKRGRALVERAKQRGRRYMQQ